MEGAAVSEHGERDNELPRGYLRACLLLLLAESPAHGYELLTQVSELGLPRPDAGTVYRTLRTLEREGLVESWWAPAVAGPARRPYRPTAAGTRSLEDVTAGVAQTHQSLSAYLRRHRDLGRPRRQPPLTLSSAS